MKCSNLKTTWDLEEGFIVTWDVDDGTTVSEQKLIIKPVTIDEPTRRVTFEATFEALENLAELYKRF